MQRSDIRLILPSKGILQHGALDLFEACGLKVFRPNPRQYAATIPSLKGVTVLFQRPGDIVTSVQDGSADFGITGLDVLAEKGGYGTINGRHQILTLHDALGFGPCALNLAVPETVSARTMADLAQWADALAQDGRVLRIATKFPIVTGQFLDQHHIRPYQLVEVEGTLEITPAIGHADLIADLVSSGTTLRDNHLRRLDDGLMLRSQACLIANCHTLQQRPRVLAIARQLLEYIEAHLRAKGSCLIIANMRGQSKEAIAQRMFNQTTISGLQGPTVAPVVPNEPQKATGNWFAVNIVVRQNELFQAIAELRAIGGSGVIVSPITYIFEEEPERYKAMLENKKKIEES